MMWGGYEGWGFGFLHMLGFWVFLILVLAVLVRGLGVWPAQRDIPGRANESALDILKARYARGEIELKEYEEKKRVLGS